MGASEIITAALGAINLANKAIEAANSGDLEKAKAFLAQSREHFSASVDAWNAAKPSN